MPPQAYVHGYSDREKKRLVDQATTLTDLLHRDTSYAPGSMVLEVGCGVGAQTLALARVQPRCKNHSNGYIPGVPWHRKKTG